MSWWCCLPRTKKQENPYSNSIGVCSTLFLCTYPNYQMLLLSGIYSEKNIRLFSYAELRSATDNFNRTKKVGRGGFGTVYKGTIRNGREVAVKVLSAESRQGIREFLTEIDVISNVKHPNLVELVGCCVEANNRILVGYLAPEYAWHGQLTKKADIYSFGVLVLEIISGTSSSKSILADDKILLEKTWELYEAKKLKELVDPVLVNYPEEEVIRYIKVALFCIQAAAARRPSMPQVVTMLSKPIRINESELTSPGYIHEYRSNVSKASTSSHSRSKNSPSLDSNMFSTVVPPTVTEMSPR
ncbi:hypothetical protein HU200_009624 [Digitaria exilis]|uniref:Protein kinase domain-containing protein n=1 Tax=Digitaria exilis TaxID=1010633 RepID=A0A835FJI8_9POAL|nr:hypothetical protein HU200_009624 [Digitaria exilis]